MSVNPGFGGQKFIENTYSKVEMLKNLIISKNAPTLIEIDGGVTLDNASRLINAGADYKNVNVISDGNIVTAPHFRDNAVWIKETLKVYYSINK
jgi:pentose-5-phosphate-3-epimerase